MIPIWHKNFLENKSFLAQEIQTNYLLDSIPSPCYILSSKSLESNLKLLSNISSLSGAKILVALKGYSFWREFDNIRKYLHGATCSGVNEARLAFEEIAKPIINKIESIQYAISQTNDTKLKLALNDNIPYSLFYLYTNKEICVFSPAYKQSQIEEILKYATHIIFNSLNQWDKFKDLINKKNQEITELFKKLKNIDKSLFNLQTPKIEVGLRINPLYSEVEPPIYNPCIPKSRLGIIPSEFYKGIDYFANKYGFKDSMEFFKSNFNGLHFHTHCEQDSTSLQTTLIYVEKYFKDFIQNSKWINFGGGHHITRKDYDCNLLINLILDFKKRYNVNIILEPGEAVGWQTGDLIGEVIDIIQNEGNVAILDISASCHMPDCLEMPYRPMCYKISHNKDLNTSQIEYDLGEDKGIYRYRFGGPTCLAGDIIGDYSFNTPLNIGDRIAFCDMIHYTIVKNTTFNGVELPSLGVIKNNQFILLKQFDYTHFKERN